MKRYFFFILLLLGITAQAQIKMHSNGRITFQNLNNTTNQGVSIDPGPDYTVNCCGKAYFKDCAFFQRSASAYQFLNQSKATNNYAMAWVLTLNNWTTTKFYVYGNGNIYGTQLYTISSNSTSKESTDNKPITGREALTTITGLKGLWYDPETQEIPELENNENIQPEAVQAMYSDFEKRTVGLAATEVETAFPEAVRTDPQNRICINYQAIVTMLVEAVKEQQRQINQLQQLLIEQNNTQK